MTQASKEALEAAEKLRYALTDHNYGDCHCSQCGIKRFSTTDAIAQFLDAFASARVAEERLRCIEYIEKQTKYDAAIQEASAGIGHEEYLSWRIAQDLRQRTPKPSAEKCGACCGKGFYVDELPMGRYEDVHCERCNGTGINEKGE